MTKPLNEYSSNEFHRWQRGAVPSEVVIQDVDAWLIVPSTSEPLCLLELKRSFMHPSEWRPFAADETNYRALLALARRANLAFRVIYWQKGVEFDDATVIATWRAKGIEQGAIVWDGPKLITPPELAEMMAEVIGAAR